MSRRPETQDGPWPLLAKRVALNTWDFFVKLPQFPEDLWEIPLHVFDTSRKITPRPHRNLLFERDPLYDPREGGHLVTHIRTGTFVRRTQVRDGNGKRSKHCNPVYLNKKKIVEINCC